MLKCKVPLSHVDKAVLELCQRCALSLSLSAAYVKQKGSNLILKVETGFKGGVCVLVKLI